MPGDVTASRDPRYGTGALNLGCVRLPKTADSREPARVDGGVYEPLHLSLSAQASAYKSRSEDGLSSLVLSPRLFATHGSIAWQDELGGTGSFGLC